MLARRHAAALLVALVIVGTRPPAAGAEGLYFREAVGGSRVGGQLGRFYRGGFTVRAGVGYHFADRWVVEAGFSGGPLDGAGPFHGRTYHRISFGVELKRLAPINRWLSAYGRVGLARTDIDLLYGEDSRGDGYRGRGVDLGGGLIAAGQMPWIGLLHPALLLVPCLRKGPRISVAAWLDVGRHDLLLHRARASSLGGAIDTMTVGFSLGGNF
jgi:hypothetical protein